MTEVSVPFPSDYQDARARFRAYVEALGARCEACPISGVGAEGEPLSIEIAALGPSDATRLIWISSGTHGVEGFLGAALQHHLLQAMAKAPLPPDTQLLLVHAVNPYGFSWCRRVDRDQIDNNRNFLLEGEDYAGAPEGYDQVDRAINLSGPPSLWSGLKSDIGLISTLLSGGGLQRLRESITGGQYTYPAGLFYGGAGPSESHRQLQEWLPPWLADRCERGLRECIFIDIHSGLGARGKLLLAPCDEESATTLPEWIPSLQGALSREGETGVPLYPVRGELLCWLRAQARAASLPSVGLLAEFGTSPGPLVLRALIREQQATLALDPNSKSLKRYRALLRERFAPADPRWRAEVIGRGLSLFSTLGLPI